jgi:flagellar biosynthesis chaperone FliJ
VLEGFENSAPLDELEHYRGRLKETLNTPISLDHIIHNLLSHKEYKDLINTCEEYIDKAKRAIQKASRRVDNSLFPMYD